MAPWSGIDDALRVPQLRAAVPHRDVHAEPLDVRDGRHQRVRPAVRRRGAVPRRSTGTACTGGFVVGPMVDAIVEANADGRYDLSSFRGRRGNPTFDAWVQPDTVAVGPPRRRLRADRGDGHGDVQPPRARRHRLARPAVAARRPARRRPRRRRGRRRARPGEIVVRGTTVMCGYWNRPELNAERARGGWHHTNDLGRFEADGTFTFVGPEGAHAQVGGGEHLPGRGRELREDASRRRRLRGDRRARRDVGAVGQGDRRASPTARR